MNAPDRRVIVALDLPDAEAAEHLLAKLLPRKPFIKVGYQLFYAVGPAWVARKKEAGFPVFLDLKLHDIPNTVKKGVESLGRLGVDLLTLHASGGSAMMEAAREAAEKTASGTHRTRLLAVTQLTSTDREMLNDELGIPGTVGEHVLRLARLAQRSGVDGVVCSGHEVRRIKEVTGSGFLAVTPGIRPAGTDAGDQKRIMTPSLAIKEGADFLVVGRPVTGAADPAAAYEAILREISHTDTRSGHA
ncbi:orotidine-5'-phosphate decarboxylase [Staphylospora marina]|uniref:orotidine-5'-phosphate decarboxylase n=1 Tax=Staphylospora marina TaxID=2490858 RepID=UPI000F5BE09D|nr:orotidine-5'-phosphate decarboxylase [Staphylospora marina]